MGGLVVLTGLSGSGKSAALAQLAAHGEQVLDLQSLACHRGSAFGGFGLQPQPTHRQFQRAVSDAVAARDTSRRLWLERCPRYLGSVGLPEDLLEAMATAPAVRLTRPRSARIAVIVEEYGGAGPALWQQALRRIARRIGQPRTALVREALDRADLAAAVDVLLTYYDPTYLKVRQVE